MNIIDKAVEYISPGAALKRHNDRYKLDIVRSFKNSGYDEGGASRRKNSLKGWNADSRTPQEDIDLNLPLLRKRSRSLIMTAPIAKSAIRRNVINVVGSGLRPKPSIEFERLNLTSEAADEWKKKTELEFSLWAESKYCDTTKVHDFYDLQQIALISALSNGDACGLLEYDKPTSFLPYGLRIHMVESDRICSPNSNGTSVNMNIKAENGNRIYNGVEIDNKGAVVAYHICTTYPSTRLQVEKKWYRVKAFGEKTGSPNVLMIFETERADQYRGVPYLAPVIESLKQLTRYSEAELMAAVINGFFTVFIKTDSNKGDMPFGGIEDDGGNVSVSAGDYKLGPGTINVLGENESIEIADSRRPSQNFDAFVTSMAKFIGAALDIPEEVLSLRFNSSYSAARAGLLEAWKAFRMKRTWLVKDFCQPVYEIWLTEAVASGRIKAPGFFLDPAIKKAWCGCEWNGPSPGMIDPVKEINAAEKRIELCVSTGEREAMELTGTDFDRNVAQLIKEKKKMQQIQVKGSGDNNAE
ncbi:phage portal protein [Anaerocolumna sp. AGMB13025]|uniref:phage portal protein n=1 Tax=Anaerocolumna sp. AGMB13025 TaxID=3039116 RepID=UPI00241E3974|nr:phage portal protein [Anaerocolumna sp. AGMB13025]WFR55366.1 phage portal protein [Anaerocolumna sp. AGMB13025]